MKTATPALSSNNNNNTNTSTSKDVNLQNKTTTSVSNRLELASSSRLSNNRWNRYHYYHYYYQYHGKNAAKWKQEIERMRLRQASSQASRQYQQSLLLRDIYEGSRAAVFGIRACNIAFGWVRSVPSNFFSHIFPFSVYYADSESLTLNNPKSQDVKSQKRVADILKNGTSLSICPSLSFRRLVDGTPLLNLSNAALSKAFKSCKTYYIALDTDKAIMRHEISNDSDASCHSGDCHIHVPTSSFYEKIYKNPSDLGQLRSKSSTTTVKHSRTPLSKVKKMRLDTTRVCLPPILSTHTKFKHPDPSTLEEDEDWFPEDDEIKIQPAEKSNSSLHKIVMPSYCPQYRTNPISPLSVEITSQLAPEDDDMSSEFRYENNFSLDSDSRYVKRYKEDFLPSSNPIYNPTDFADIESILQPGYTNNFQSQEFEQEEDLIVNTNHITYYRDMNIHILDTDTIIESGREQNQQVVGALPILSDFCVPSTDFDIGDEHSYIGNRQAEEYHPLESYFQPDYRAVLPNYCYPYNDSTYDIFNNLCSYNNIQSLPSPRSSFSTLPSDSYVDFSLNVGEDPEDKQDTANDESDTESDSEGDDENSDNNNNNNNDKNNTLETKSTLTSNDLYLRFLQSNNPQALAKANRSPGHSKRLQARISKKYNNNQSRISSSLYATVLTASLRNNRPPTRGR